MSQPGDQIDNPRTGQRMIFRSTGTDTDGEVLRIECFNSPHGPKEPEHVHPRQESRFEILAGSVLFNINGQERHARPGEVVTIPAGVPHYFWNGGDEEAQYVQEFRPALQSDRFFETLFGLARDGKLNPTGYPNLLQIAVSAPAFADEIRLTRPPWLVQRVVCAVLAPIARLRGYRAIYPQYSRTR